MQGLQRIFDFYIFGNIHVGLATFSLVKITLLLYGNDQNTLPFFIFFSTVLSYNLIRLYRRKSIKGFFADFLDVHRRDVFILCTLAAAGMGYFALQLHFYEVLSMLPFLMMTIFYVLPMRTMSGTRTSLRTISGVKIFVIAFCWAGVTVVIPAIHMKLSISLEILGIFVQRLLFVLAITIPFDVRDLSHDDANLKTIPQLLGVSNAKRFGLLLLMLFLGFSMGLNSHDVYRLRVEFFIAFISFLLLVRSSEHQHKYYSTFFVESIPIVWMLLML